MSGHHPTNRRAPAFVAAGAAIKRRRRLGRAGLVAAETGTRGNASRLTSALLSGLIVGAISLGFTAAASAGIDQWTQSQVPGVTTAAAPAEAYDPVNGILYEAFTSGGNVYWGPSTTTNNAWVQVPGANSTLTPAITVDSNGLQWIAWTQTGTDAVKVASIFGASEQVDGGQGQSSQGPALCSDGTNLYVAFKGKSPNVYVSENPANVNVPWQHEVTVPNAQSSYTPALSCDSDEGVIAWTNPLIQNSPSPTQVNVARFSVSSTISSSSFGTVAGNLGYAIPGATSFAGPAVDVNDFTAAPGPAVFWTTASDTIQYTGCNANLGYDAGCDWEAPATLPIVRTTTAPAEASYSASSTSSCIVNDYTNVAVAGRTAPFGLYNLSYDEQVNACIP